jgi:hypothetical protein
VRLGVVNGELHGPYVPPSTEHSDVPLLASVIVNTMFGVLSETGCCSVGELIETIGLVVSTLKFLVTVELLPAASIARTLTACGPSVNVPVVKGELQPAKAPPSVEHAIEPGFVSTTLKTIGGVLTFT